MVWTKRIVIPSVAAFVLLSTAVSVAILRLGGVIGWPGHGLVIAFLALLLALTVALLLSVYAEMMREFEPDYWNPLIEWVIWCLPWGPRKPR